MVYKNFTIKQLKECDINTAISLVWNVFKEFEAPDYSDEGIKSFQEFIEYNSIIETIREKSLYFWGCFDNEKLVGVLAIRNSNHISLLFVDKNYHKLGIARKLVHTGVQTCIHNNNKLTEITVNSSPYAVEVYHRLGFKDTDVEQTVTGIRFTPMKLLVYSE